MLREKIECTFLKALAPGREAIIKIRLFYKTHTEAV